MLGRLSPVIIASISFFYQTGFIIGEPITQHGNRQAEARSKTLRIPGLTVKLWW